MPSGRNGRSALGVDKGNESEYNVYTGTEDFMREVKKNDRSAFSRSLANKTSGMVEGEVKNIIIYAAENIMDHKRVQKQKR